MSREAAASRLYVIARTSAIDALGGPRAFEIAGPAIRRMAIGSALLDLLAQQDESVAADTVRELLGALHGKLAEEGEFNWSDVERRLAERR